MADENKKKDDVEATRKSLTNLIASLLTRYKSQKDANVKEILMLIAALNMMNAPGDPQYTTSTARRLVSGVK